MSNHLHFNNRRAGCLTCNMHKNCTSLCPLEVKLTPFALHFFVKCLKQFESVKFRFG